MNVWVNNNGKTLGPLPWELVMKHHLNGKIPGSAMVTENQLDWYPLEKLVKRRLNAANPVGPVNTGSQQINSVTGVQKEPNAQPDNLQHQKPVVLKLASLDSGNSSSFSAEQLPRGASTQQREMTHSYTKTYLTRNAQYLLLACIFIVIVLLVCGFFVLRNHSGNTDLATLYEQHKKAIALVVMITEDYDGERKIKPIATAFAISPNVFVTTARVAQYLKGKSKQSSGYKTVTGVELRINGAEGQSYQISKISVHPNFESSNNNGEFDVALLTIEEKTDCFFEKASEKELEKLKIGLDLGVAGFNENVNVNYPNATVIKGMITQLSDFNDKILDPKNNHKIETGIFAMAEGVQGSPVFDANGRIIGIMLGHGTSAVRIDQIERMGGGHFGKRFN